MHVLNTKISCARRNREVSRESIKESGLSCFYTRACPANGVTVSLETQEGYSEIDSTVDEFCCLFTRPFSCSAYSR